MNLKNKNSLRHLGQAGIYFNSGLTMAFALLFWLAIGYFADSYFNAEPLFLIIGIVFGMLSVFYELFKLIKISMKNEKREQNNNVS